MRRLVADALVVFTFAVLPGLATVWVLVNV